MSETSPVKRFFGPDGGLSGVIESYEPRTEQERMAGAVFRAIEDDGKLIVEAGTGVGKSMAYLIPVMEALSSEIIERAVISTYTKALQRQLIEKDIPLLAERFFPELRYVIALGSENYLCLRRLGLSRQYGLFDPPDEGGLPALMKWSEETETGLLMEISPPLSLWRRVCREPDNCHGKDCRFYRACHYQKAKAEERKARLIIANHHLFFANMASGWNVLSPFEMAVLDEAHEVERVATDYLGYELSNTRISYILDNLISRRGRGLLMRLPWLDEVRLRELSGLIDRVRGQAERFFREVSGFLSGEKTRRVRQSGVFLDILSEHMEQLGEELHSLYEESVDQEEKRELRTAEERVGGVVETLKAINGQDLEGHVYWAEEEGRRIRLVATPIEVADRLREELFNVLGPVVFTSATLSVGGSLDYTKSCLGMEEADTLLLHSPFSYRDQALLYLPGDLPLPDSSEYIRRLTDEVQTIIRTVDGKALVLFTSYAVMNQVLDVVEFDGFRIFVQGDMENYSLMEAFKKAGRAALFGTYTFWQGIDLPGDLLHAVIITKLPFAVPTEPVTEARMEALKEKGLDPFYAFQVPQAAITLKQGVGRLIRSSNDYGVVAILDSRVLTRSYGRFFLESLPAMEIVHDRGRLKDAFLKRKNLFGDPSFQTLQDC